MLLSPLLYRWGVRMTEAKTRSYLWIWGAQDEIPRHCQFGVAYFVAFCRFKSHFLQSSIAAMSAQSFCKSSHNYCWGEEQCPRCWSLSLASQIDGNRQASLQGWWSIAFIPRTLPWQFPALSFLSLAANESDPISFSSRPSPLQKCVLCSVWSWSLIENKLCDHLIWHYCNVYA